MISMKICLPNLLKTVAKRFGQNEIKFYSEILEDNPTSTFGFTNEDSLKNI